MTWKERLARVRRDLAALNDAARSDELIESLETAEEHLDEVEQLCEREWG